MAPDQKGIQRTGIGLFHGGMLGQLAELPQRGRADPQQPAHLAGPVDRSRRNPLGQQQGVKLTLGLRPEVEGRGQTYLPVTVSVTGVTHTNAPQDSLGGLTWSRRWRFE